MKLINYIRFTLKYAGWGGWIQPIVLKICYLVRGWPMYNYLSLCWDGGQFFFREYPKIPIQFFHCQNLPYKFKIALTFVKFTKKSNNRKRK